MLLGNVFDVYSGRGCLFLFVVPVDDMIFFVSDGITCSLL